MSEELLGFEADAQLFDDDPQATLDRLRLRKEDFSSGGDNWNEYPVVRYLLSKEFEPIAGIQEVVRHTPLYAISIAMIFIGLFAFGAVYLRAV